MGKDATWGVMLASLGASQGCAQSSDLFPWPTGPASPSLPHWSCQPAEVRQAGASIPSCPSLMLLPAPRSQVL